VETWTCEEFDLTPHRSASFRLRFRSLNNNPFSDGWSIDDVKIEEDSCNLVDFCQIDSPESVQVAAGQPTPDILGTVFVAGVTDLAGQGTGVLAQVGYGTESTPPSTWTQWEDCTYLDDVGAHDRYSGTLTVPAEGTFDYAYRFMHEPDPGTTWTYADLDGTDPEACAGNGYETAMAGRLVVAGAPDISVFPSSLSITVPPGLSTDATLYITNTGTASVSFEILEDDGDPSPARALAGRELTANPRVAENASASAATLRWDVPWISEEPSAGSVVPGDTLDVLVTVNAETLSEGAYEGYLVVLHSDADENPVVVVVNLEVTPQTGPATIAYGTVLVDSLSPVADTDTLRFSGAAGEEIHLTLADTGGNHEPRAELLGPDLAPLDTLGIDDTGVSKTIDLMATGQYTIVVSDAGNDATGSYHLGLERLFPASESAVTLSYGTARSDSITPVADVDVFVFDGVADQTIELTLMDTGGDHQPYAHLFNPSRDGVVAFGADGTADSYVIALTTTGLYTLLVGDLGDDQTGSYGVDLRTVSVTCSVAASVSTGHAPLAVTFSVQVSGGASDALFWDFGDGVTEQTPIVSQTTHVYGERGVYTATVRARAGVATVCLAASGEIAVVQEATAAYVTAGLDAFVGLSVPLVIAPGATGIPFDRLLGAPDPENWKLGRWSPADSTYITAGDRLTELQPGKGYWLVTREPLELTVSGSTIPDRDVVLPLELGPGNRPGWNQMGNPFDFPVPVNVLRVSDGSQTFFLTDSSNSLLTEPVVKVWQNATYVNADTLRPGAAGWVKRHSDSPVDLIVPVLPLRGTVAPVARPQEPAPAGWAIGIRARQGTVWTEEILLGASELAREGWDPLDLSLPPMPGERLVLSIPRREWGRLSGDYLCDIRPQSLRMGWRFAVAGANAPGEFGLNVRAERLPGETRLWLTELSSMSTWEIFPGEELSFAATGAVREFELLADLEGASDFGRTPRAGFLGSYPNPFRHVVGFRFYVDRPTELSVTVFDLAGRRVWASDGRNAGPGEHVLLWDGRDNGDLHVASGVYLARCRMGADVDTRRITRLR
jgi:hypothetical protein